MRVLILIALFLSLASPVMAENQAMHYIVTPKAPQKPAISDITPDTNQDQDEDNKKSKIWAHYKALAAGAPSNEESGPVETSAPKTERAATETSAPTGLAAIIQQYHENKKRQSEMRSITVMPPAAPALPDAKE